jgi:hypothetical protein
VNLLALQAEAGELLLIEPRGLISSHARAPSASLVA